ncbi:DNA mismatch repair protein MutT, partial [bacterium]|nr:DNA mismatch repair protein MutT [bacterium]
IYLCIGLSLGESNPEDCEQIDVRKIHFTEALEMVMTGEITDALTMMALMKLAIMTETLHP